MLNYCLEEAKNGKDLDELRKELKQFELEDDDISQIIKYVDNKLINDALTGAHKSHKKEYYLIGWFLFVTGLFITIATYIGLINMGNSYIISFGPIIAGLALIVSNRTNS